MLPPRYPLGKPPARQVLVGAGSRRSRGSGISEGSVENEGPETAVSQRQCVWYSQTYTGIPNKIAERHPMSVLEYGQAILLTMDL